MPGLNTGSGEGGKENPVESEEEAEQAALDAMIASALSESRKVDEMEKMSEKQVDELIAKMSRTQAKLEKALKAWETDKNTLETFDPYAELSMKTLDLLLQEGVVSKDTAAKVRKLQSQYEELLKAPVLTEGVQKGMAVVSDRLNKESDKIDADLAGVRDAFNARRTELRREAEAFYVAWIAELQEEVRSLREHPRVSDRLSKEEAKALEAKRDARAAAEAVHAKQLEKVFAALRSETQSVASRNDNAFRRLAEVVGDPDVRKKLFAAFVDVDKKAQEKLVSELRVKLREAILHGKDTGTIASSSEVVPWDNRSSVDYVEAVTLLGQKLADEAIDAATKSGGKAAEVAKIIEGQRLTLLTEYAALRELFGPRRLRSGDPSFWDLIKNRDKIRAAEAAAAKVQAEKAEAARRRKEQFDEKAREMISRGGIEVKATLHRETRGAREIYGEARGVVLLEKSRRPDGGEWTWKVKETLGLPPEAELPVGKYFKNLTMLDAKQWLRTAMNGKFKVENGRYTERLPEAPPAKDKKE